MWEEEDGEEGLAQRHQIWDSRHSELKQVEDKPHARLLSPSLVTCGPQNTSLGSLNCPHSRSHPPYTLTKSPHNIKPKLGVIIQQPPLPQLRATKRLPQWPWRHLQ